MLEYVRKGNRADGSDRNDQTARLVVKPNEQRPWANVSSPVPSKPVAVVTPPSDPSTDEIEEPLYSSDLFEEEETLAPEARRLMIAGYYVAAMDSPPEEEDAQTISWILKEFKMPKGSRDVVKRVLTAFRKCKKDMVRYTGERAPFHR